MSAKAATKDLAKFFFVGNVWLLSDLLITSSHGCSDSFLPSGVTHLVTVHCLIPGTAVVSRRHPAVWRHRPRGMLAPEISAPSSSRTTIAGTAIKANPVAVSMRAVSLSKRLIALTE